MEHPTKRRKVRRGTRSCWSCKRRKVRCIFASPADTVCITCHRRGTKCIGQDLYDPESPESLQGSAGPLASLATSDPQDATKQRGNNTELLTPVSATHEYLFTTAADESGCLPKVDLHSTHGYPLTFTSGEPQHRITHALISSLPPQRDLDIILHKLNNVCLSSYASKLQINPSRRKGLAVTSVSLRSPHSHPVRLARQMLLLAVGMQHCCFKTTVADLSQHPRNIAERLAHAAIELVTSNDALLQNVESVDNIVLEACYFTNKGDMQRCWLALRRAIMAAQLLRFHEASALDPQTSDLPELDASVVWSCTQGMERMVSLLVGLPTSVPLTENIDSMGLNAVAKSMAARVIKRNETVDPHAALDLTLKIHDEVLRIHEELSTVQKATREEPDVQILFHGLCLQTMILQLHAQYMMFSLDTMRRLQSTVACVQACRELLNQYTELRRLDSIHPCCGMSDFMACVGAIMLVMAHVVGNAVPRTENVIAFQRPGDCGLLERTLKTITSHQEKEEGSFVATCVKTLEQLLKLENCAARGQTVHLGRLPTSLTVQDVVHSRLLIEISGAGMIEICRIGCPNKSQSDGFVIGGVGTVQIELLPEIELGCDTTTALPTISGRGDDGIGNSVSRISDTTTTWTQSETLDQDWLFDGVFDASTFLDAFAHGNLDFSNETF